MDKLQSGDKSKKDGWRTELPDAGLGKAVLEKLHEDKRKDVMWEGKCSGTVYVDPPVLVSIQNENNSTWQIFKKILAIILCSCMSCCSYIGGSESEGHFTLINEAYSM